MTVGLIDFALGSSILLIYKKKPEPAVSSSSSSVSSKQRLANNWIRSEPRKGRNLEPDSCQGKLDSSRLEQNWLFIRRALIRFRSDRSVPIVAAEHQRRSKSNKAGKLNYSPPAVHRVASRRVATKNLFRRRRRHFSLEKKILFSFHF